jgi:hypothetical protein
LTEPDVAITDFLLTLEAALFSLLLWRSGYAGSDLRIPFVVFFGATAAAALTGGLVHGFFAGSTSGAGVVLWRISLLALGLVALATWAIGARLILTTSAARVVQMAAVAITIGYAAVVVAVNDSFWVAIADYLPATLFLFVAFAIVHQRNQLPTLSGLLGLALTLVAAFVQQQRIALHPVYFNHNALYHAIQAVGLFLIFRSAREIV